jgi:sulfoxide reductase heme-binding subunit YedZ
MPGWISTSFYSLLALPALIVGIEAWRGTLGTNPLERLIREPGHWALVFLFCTLAVTPLRHAGVRIARLLRRRWGRRLADWNGLVRLRRPLGLACFAYALVHLAVYATLDVGLDVGEFVNDLRHKPFVLAGLACFVLLLPLAVTSTEAWMRRLKRNWKRLHWLVYPASLVAMLHFIWLSKPGVTRPYAYAAVLAILLSYRVVIRYWPSALRMPLTDDEAPERPAGGR